jgi:hypothetical protein
MLSKHAVDMETIFCGQRDEMAAARFSVMAVRTAGRVQVQSVHGGKASTYETNFVSEQISTWRRCESLRLYLSS